MRDTDEAALEQALADLAEAERAARPRPGAGLTERVLADAAGIAATRAAGAATGRDGARGRGWRALAALLPRPAGLAACGLACLILGIGLGYLSAAPETGGVPAGGGIEAMLLAALGPGDAPGEFPL